MSVLLELVLSEPGIDDFSSAALVQELAPIELKSALITRRVIGIPSTQGAFEIAAQCLDLVELFAERLFFFLSFGVGDGLHQVALGLHEADALLRDGFALSSRLAAKN